MGEAVSYQLEDGVAWLVIDRPEARNAINQAVGKGLWEGFRRFEEDPAAAVLVLTGTGEAFCAGADLKEMAALGLTVPPRDMAPHLGQNLEVTKPVIAAIGGAAFGGGLELALACDIRLAAEGVQLGLPEVRLGIIPGAGGTQRLARLVGLATAKALVLTGHRIDAGRAAALGLVAAAVPPNELRAEAARWAADLAAAGPLAVAQAKRALDDGHGRPLSEALAIERACYEVVLASDDRDEGLRAFAEKRPPRFTGR